MGEEGQAGERGLNSLRNIWFEGQSEPLQVATTNAEENSPGFGEGGGTERQGKSGRKIS